MTQTTPKHYIGCPVTMELAPCNCRTETTTIDEICEKLERIRQYCGAELTDWQCGYLLPDIDAVLEKVKGLIK